MGKAPVTKQCLRFPPLAALDLLCVLRALAEDSFNAVLQSGMRIGKVSDTSWQILLPVRPDKMDGGDAAIKAFRDKVKLSYQNDANHPVGREVEQGMSVNMTGLVPPLSAAIILALHADVDDVPAAQSGERMILVQGATPDVAPVFADIIRQGRDVRTAGVQKLVTGQDAGFLLLTDDAEDYGTVSAHLQRHDLNAATHTLLPHPVGAMRLWLEQSVQIRNAENGKALGSVLVAAKAARAMPQDLSDIAVLVTSQTSAEIYLHCKETVQDAPKVAEIVAQTLEPVQPFDVTTIQFRPEKDATQALAQKIKELRRKVGYHVALQPLPRGVGPGVDIEPILETIADLQMQVDQITALGAPQLRLMRFSDAQLPCMIDGLRRLPPEKLRDGTLQYAACHSAGRAEPAHYLLYDPQFTFMRVAETHWRADTDPHPISYWLEPFVAEAQMTRISKTQVFVPSGHFMVPSLAHFGGNIDDTLRLVLGNLFDAEQSLIADENHSAYFLFTPSSAEGFRFEVEVLDGDAFRPLHQHLEWINDYLQVRSPVAVDADRLAAVATGLYEGGVAKALKADLDADLKTLDDTWTNTQAKVEADAFAAINMMANEMDAVSTRIADLHTYLARAGQEMTGLEKVAASATQALKTLDHTGPSLAAKDNAMLRSREDFENRVETEVALAEQLIERTQTRVDQLRNRLQRIKDWGAS